MTLRKLFGLALQWSEYLGQSVEGKPTIQNVIDIAKIIAGRDAKDTSIDVVEMLVERWGGILGPQDTEEDQDTPPSFAPFFATFGPVPPPATEAKDEPGSSEAADTPDPSDV